MAIGMTVVIIAGGIDLSVGSLVALSAVLSTWLIRASAARGGGDRRRHGVGLCRGHWRVCFGWSRTGLLVTGFHVPPFIVTLRR